MNAEKQDRSPGNPKRKAGGNAKTSAPPGYYTLAQAVKASGLPESTFRSYVMTGRIEHYVPEYRLGTRRPNGYYPINQVDELGRKVRSANSMKIETRVATPDDAQGTFDVLAALKWEKSAATPEQRQSWMAKNPYVDFIVTVEIGGKRRVGGYIHAGPYTDQAMHDMMAGLIRGKDITPDDIHPAEPGAYEMLYVGIAVRPDFPKNEYLAATLLSGFLRFLQDVANDQRIVIKKLYALSAEEGGITLCRKLGFQEYGKGNFRDEPDHEPFMQFVLDLEHSDEHFARMYREGIAQP